MLSAIGALSHATCCVAAEPTVKVDTVPAQRGVIGQPIRAYGIVAASAANMTTVNLPYVARILRLWVQSGQTVKRGQPLFDAQADPAAALALTQARSAAVLASGERKRMQALLNQGLATTSQLAIAQKAEDDAAQALALEQQTGVRIGDRTIVAPADGVVLQVAAGRGDQVQAGTAVVQISIVGTSDARRGASSTSAHAPASRAHANMATVPPSHGNVLLSVEPTEASQIRTGDVVTIHGVASALTHDAVTGRVVFVGAAIDLQSQLVSVGADVSVLGTPYLPGTHVAADIATQTGIHWVVPRDAVLKDAKSAYLFQIAPDHIAHRVDVAIAVEDGNRYGVDGPIDAARPMVVSGNDELSDGMGVQRSGDAAR